MEQSTQQSTQESPISRFRADRRRWLRAFVIWIVVTCIVAFSPGPGINWFAVAGLQVIIVASLVIFALGRRRQ